MKIVKEILYESNDSNNIILFRGQIHERYVPIRQGYSESYHMLFTHKDINTAFFYTQLPPVDRIDNKYRELLIFSVPNKIKRVSGAYIDRLPKSKLDEFKNEGFVGVMSDIGELDVDKNEIGLFEMYEPIRRFSTQSGRFSNKSLMIMKEKYGLKDRYIKLEETNSSK